MTDRVGLLCEGFYEDAQQFVGVIDLVRILPDDPYERRFRLWLVQLFEVGT